jgi:hypothetical protein
MRVRGVGATASYELIPGCSCFWCVRGLAVDSDLGKLFVEDRLIRRPVKEQRRDTANAMGGT